jgi:hypothetical protein
LPSAGIALLAGALAGIPLLAQDQNESPVSRLPMEDNQLWSDYQYSFSVSKRLEAALSGTLRLGNDMSRLVYERVGAAVSVQAGRHVTFTPGYSFSGYEPLPGRNIRENRIYAEVNFHCSLGNFGLSDRNRIEFRTFPSLSYFRYRNRFQVEHPVEVGHLGLRVYVSDEVFYDGLLNAWNRNRLTAGITRKMSRILSMDFYYCRQEDRYSLPGDTNAVGIGFKFRS